MVVEERGKITGQRVLSGGKVETSFEAKGKILGVEETDMATYLSEVRADGTIYGEGQGIVMTKEGMLTWKGTGVGWFTERGQSFRGAVYYESTSQKFMRLNKVAAVFEYEVDQDGNTTGKSWEWK